MASTVTLPSFQTPKGAVAGGRYPHAMPDELEEERKRDGPKASEATGKQKASEATGKQKASEATGKQKGSEATGGVFTSYGIASAVLAVVSVVAVALAAFIWSGHRAELDERSYQTQVLQAAADWTNVL